MYYVYAHYKADDKDGLPFYIGKGKLNRDVSESRSHFWKNITTKHGLIVKRIKENLTEQEAWDLEKQLILQYGKLIDGTGCLCNIADGGEGASGTVHSNETKKKWSDAKKGKTYEEIYGVEQAAILREKRRQARLGRKYSNETKKKLSEKKLGVNNPMYNKSISDEHRAKLSQAKLGKPGNAKGKVFTDTTRQAMSESAKLREADPVKRQSISAKLTGIKRSEETRKRMAESAKLREANKKLQNKEK